MNKNTKNTENMQNSFILSPKANIFTSNQSSPFPDFPPSSQPMPIIPLSDASTPLPALYSFSAQIESLLIDSKNLSPLAFKLLLYIQFCSYKLPEIPSTPYSEYMDPLEHTFDPYAISLSDFLRITGYGFRQAYRALAEINSYKPEFSRYYFKRENLFSTKKETESHEKG